MAGMSSERLPAPPRRPRMVNWYAPGQLLSTGLQVLGAVMNDVRLEGEYQYYSYLDGYSVHTDEELPRLTAGGEVRSEEEDLVGR